MLLECANVGDLIRGRDPASGDADEAAATGLARRGDDGARPGLLAAVRRRERKRSARAASESRARSASATSRPSASPIRLCIS